ncbi:MAG TPA: hypothetical protein VF603_05960 [Allosphingosinicella sp.]
MTYLIIYSLFIDTIPASGIRVIRGFECTSDAILVHGDACPDLSSEAYQDAGWEAVSLWSRRSITVVRVGLAVSWIVFTVGLILIVGSVVAGRKTSRRRKAR